MKKKILLIVAIVAAMCCIFAISASAAVVSVDDPEYKNAMTDGMTQVTLSDGTTVCDLYDEEGYALSYYKDANGVLTSIRSEDLVYNLSDTKLYSITLADGTVLATTASAGKNKMVIANLRCTEITDFNNDNMFKNNNNGLQYIFMPDSIKNLIGYAFGLNNTLLGCYFSAASELTTINGNTFLKCTNLGGFYIPSGVTSIGADAFEECYKLYFVEDPTKVATKPAIYTFPTGLNSIAGETFKFCQNMNDTIVVGAGITTVPNNWAFAFKDSVSRNVVFLGQLTAFTASNQVQNTTFYFANTSVSFTPVNQGSNNKFYFCSAENATHIANPNATAIVPATCTENAKETTYCFCGASMGESEVADSALGHNHDLENGATLVGIEYADFAAEGNKVVKCSRCDVEDKTQTAIAIFGTAQFSMSEDGAEICVSYTINNEAYGAFLAANEGASLEFGLVAAASIDAGIESPLDAANKIAHDFTGSGYTAFDLRLSGDWETQSEVYLSMALYTSYKANDGAEATVNYVTEEGSATACQVVTYAGIAAGYENNVDAE